MPEEDQQLKPENDEKLCQDFPKLYADRHASMRTTCMCWGFTCADGWFDIIYRLSVDLTKMIEDMDDSTCMCGHQVCEHSVDLKGCDTSAEEGHPCCCEGFTPLKDQFRASQVKEKFGTLRFYMTYETEEMSERIHQAENESAHTCEACGQPGQLCSVTGWYMTLCKKCWEEDQKDIKAELGRDFEPENCWYGKKEDPLDLEHNHMRIDIVVPKD